MRHGRYFGGRRNAIRPIRPSCGRQFEHQLPERSLSGSVSLPHARRRIAAGWGSLRPLEFYMKSLRTEYLPSESEAPQFRETDDQKDQRDHKSQIRESECSEETHEVQDPPLAACVQTQQEAIALAGNNPFTLARALKAFEITIGIKLGKFGLEAAFAEWWNEWETQLSGIRDDYKAAFLSGYMRSKTPLGVNPLESAIASAASEPLPKQAEAYAPHIARLVAVGWHLQKLNKGREFYLSQRSAAKILGGKLTAAVAVLDMLEFDGVFIVVERGKEGGRRATRYRLSVGPQ